MNTTALLTLITLFLPTACHGASQKSRYGQVYRYDAGEFVTYTQNCLNDTHYRYARLMKKTGKISACYSKQTSLGNYTDLADNPKALYKHLVTLWFEQEPTRYHTQQTQSIHCATCRTAPNTTDNSITMLLQQETVTPGRIAGKSLVNAQALYVRKAVV